MQVPGWSGAACPDSLLPYSQQDPARSRSQPACDRGGPTAAPVRADRRSPDAAPAREPCAAQPQLATDDAEDPESSAAADVTVVPTSPAGPVVSAAASRPPALAHHEAVSRPTPPRGHAGRRPVTRQRRARAIGGEGNGLRCRRRAARPQPNRAQPKCGRNACASSLLRYCVSNANDIRQLLSQDW